MINYREFQSSLSVYIFDFKVDFLRYSYFEYCIFEMSDFWTFFPAPIVHKNEALFGLTHSTLINSLVVSQIDGFICF